MIFQLPLNVSLQDDATFENFYNGKNQAVLAYLKVEQWESICLLGSPGSGLTHILQAICHQTNHCLYLPLKQLEQFEPEILEGVEQLDLLAIDDVDLLAGKVNWENALFHAFNRIQLANKRLIISSHYPLECLAFNLPDLKSRLQSLLLLTIEPLDDEGKMQALQLRAMRRGLIMSAEVAQFILRHAPRDSIHLFALLEKLDRMSLSQQRRLTIPLIKDALCS